MSRVQLLILYFQCFKLKMACLFPYRKMSKKNKKKNNIKYNLLYLKKDIGKELSKKKTKTKRVRSCPLKNL